MKQRQLEIILEQVQSFKFPSATREQYATSAPIAAQRLYFAYLRGDIAGLTVVDLGCGTGVLAVGAALLGGVSTGVDSDEQALDLARTNARLLGVQVSWLNSRIEDSRVRSTRS